MSLQQTYTTQIAPRLMTELGLTHALAVPRLRHVSVNVGTGHGLKDPKFNEVVEHTLTRITGQKPVRTLAKKSISNFKIRQGLVVGYQVTLRGQRMYDFVDKLIHVTLPRIRDFRGLDPKSIDARGNLTIGFREHLVFPEIRSDEVEKIHGLEVTLATNAGTKERGYVLLKALGFPFK
ncbi:50S ribosomal protein L5 [Candidatus Uhrbacteria bacterium]|nr:50S ribosomal protein L5 [Candidatus Uhrbacteria bacterium]